MNHNPWLIKMENKYNKKSLPSGEAFAKYAKIDDRSRAVQSPLMVRV